jgi:hypothetical protein
MKIRDLAAESLVADIPSNKGFKLRVKLNSVLVQVSI